MDLDNLVSVDMLEVTHQNGVHEQLPASGEDAVGSENVNGTVCKTSETAMPNGNLEMVFKLDGDETVKSRAGKVNEGSNIPSTSKVGSLFFGMVSLLKQLFSFEFHFFCPCFRVGR